MTLFTFNALQTLMAAQRKEFSLIHEGFTVQRASCEAACAEAPSHPILERLQHGLQVQQEVSRMWCQLAGQQLAVTQLVCHAGLGDTRIDYDVLPHKSMVDYQQQLFHTRLQATTSLREAIARAPDRPEKEQLAHLLKPSQPQQRDFAALRGFPCPMLDLWQYCKGEMLGVHAGNLRENGVQDDGIFWTANTLREVRSYLEDSDDVALCPPSLTMANISSNAYLLSGPDLRGSAGNANNLAVRLAALSPALS